MYLEGKPNGADQAGAVTTTLVSHMGPDLINLVKLIAFQELKNKWSERSNKWSLYPITLLNQTLNVQTSRQNNYRENSVVSSESIVLNFCREFGYQMGVSITNHIIHVRDITSQLTLLEMKAFDLFLSSRSTDLLYPFHAASCKGVFPYCK